MCILICVYLRNTYYGMVYNMAKNIRDKVNAHQLENGKIQCSIFTPQNIMKPFKRITGFLTNLESLPE